MENASKALIIAGAILLAILIIGLAVFIYNQAANTVSDTGMDQIAIREFNGQFEQYLNGEIGAVKAKSLIKAVQQSNRTSNITIKLPEIADENDIIVGHKYLTDAGYIDGVISSIIITDANGSSGGGSSSGGDILEEDISVRDFDMQFYGYVRNPYPGEIIYAVQTFNRTNMLDLQTIVETSNTLYPSHRIMLVLPSDFSSHPEYSTYYSEPVFDQKGYIIRINVTLC